MAPPTDRAIVTAASAEAEKVSKESIMYVVTLSWTVVIPRPATPLPIMGTIQEFRRSSVQPYHSVPMTTIWIYVSKTSSLLPHCEVDSPALQQWSPAT